MSAFVACLNTNILALAGADVYDTFISVLQGHSQLVLKEMHKHRVARKVRNLSGLRLNF